MLRSLLPGFSTNRRMISERCSAIGLLHKPAGETSMASGSRPGHFAVRRMIKRDIKGHRAASRRGTGGRNRLPEGRQCRQDGVADLLSHLVPCPIGKPPDAESDWANNSNTSGCWSDQFRGHRQNRTGLARHGTDLGEGQAQRFGQFRSKQGLADPGSPASSSGDTRNRSGG